ncbi:hypothetical protein H8S51_010050 [Roseburia rectibacter]|jgi:hypothetical protein|uniref:hypothetical protein n=1 Tax=Roseburia rectibacter TaxID=2763062 RepID=UPI00164ACE8B|nr:hypothetical protein [Roseburia rectibacter]UMY98661.1 hypothetical protein H8S51_010050 [Roseburia rectibacter]
MKKTTGICLFTGMIFLLLILVVYLLSIQQNTGIGKENLTASTEKISDENDTEQIVRSTEIIAICEPYTYVIKQKNGVLVVYQSDGVTEFFETNIRIRDLDADMVEKIENGIFFSDDRELYDFLESYSS